MTQRILMTADTVGGVWTYAMDLCRELCAAGDQVRLVTMGGRLSDAQHQQSAAIDGLDIVQTTFRLEWQDQPWDDVDAAGQTLLDQAEEFRPDVVHLNNFAHGNLPFGAPVLVVGHSCVETWWRAVHGAAPPAEQWEVYRQRVVAGIRGSDLFIAPTRSMLDAYERVYGRHRRAMAIHNGRDAAGYRPAARQPFILAAGRLWDEAKNLALLDAAAAQLDWPVRVAGAETSPDGRDVTGHRVQPLGQLAPAALAQQMRHAAIYALPARYEPFGLSVLEAAISGCALVLGDIPTLRELWQDAAVFVDPQDADELAQCINRLVRQTDRLQALADAAAERARRYTSQRMARQYAAVYAQLAAARSPARLAWPREN
jgi:glycosyltransferase involved in cell wall biosynthesis